MLLCLCSAESATATDRFDGIRELIRSGLVDQSVPSLAVAVAQDAEILWEEGFGWADREKRVPANGHTMYSLASISKPITATGLMTLVQAGKVGLDSPVNDYLGNAQLHARLGNARAATVRRVADHSSGLPGHAQFFYDDEPYRPPSMDETILRYGNLITPPGERYEYSNLGYGVLDHVIERVSGMTYAEFMRREVFLPLGLTHTSVNVGPGLEAYTATRYGRDGVPIPFYAFDHPGASAVFSSAHDLARFGMFHLKAHLRDQKAILSDASLDEMHRASITARGAAYGIGFFVATSNGYRVVSHSGGMGGVATQMLLFPQKKLAIVVLSNASSNLPFTVADLIAKEMLPEWQAVRREDEHKPPDFVTPPSLRGVWKGALSTYVREVPMELVFQPDGSVQAHLAGQLRTLVSDAQFQNGIFTGEVVLRIGTPDTERYSYTVWLSLTLRGDELDGGACALGGKEPRVRNELTHWVALKRVRP